MRQLFRIAEGGSFARDVLALHDETHDGEPLLHLVMQHGERTHAGRFRSLDEHRTYAHATLARLPEHLLALDETATPYPVVLSHRLRDARDRTRRALEALGR